MAFTDAQVAALNAKLDVRNVKQREQSGRKLSYIEGWHAIAEANEIFGFDAWTRETIDLRCVSERQRQIGKGQYAKEGWGVSYLAKVRVMVGDVVREGCGTGHGIDADLGLAHESALKEAETDAMKRALMTFGNRFGLALYDKDQANVEREPARFQAPSIAPEGEDFWGCDGPGLTANAAKQQGLGEIHDGLLHEASELADREALGAWCRAKQPEIARMPRSWRVLLRTAVDERAAELGISNDRKAA